MRKIITPDVFAAVRIIEKSGVKEDLVPLIKDIAKKGTSALDSGILGILTALFSVARMETAIYEWLAPIVGKTVDEIRELPPIDFVKLVEDLAAENDLTSFFKYVSDLMGRK